MKLEEKIVNSKMVWQYNDGGFSDDDRHNAMTVGMITEISLGRLDNVKSYIEAVIKKISKLRRHCCSGLGHEFTNYMSLFGSIEIITSFMNEPNEQLRELVLEMFNVPAIHNRCLAHENTDLDEVTCPSESLFIAKYLIKKYNLKYDGEGWI